MPNPKTALLSFVAIGLFLAIYAFYSQAAQCPLLVMKAYKTESSPSVYYLSSDCKKRPIRNPDVYFSHFVDWSDARPTTAAILNQIPDHALSFLPWGPRRHFQNGSLLKTVSDPRVYLVLKNKRIPIASESAFLDLGFQWGWVEDVTPEVLDRYSQAPLLNLGDDYPNGFAFKQVNSPKVYYVETSANGAQSKRHITSFAQLAADYRTDRIATLSQPKVLADASTTTPPAIVTPPEAPVAQSSAPGPQPSAPPPVPPLTLPPAPITLSPAPTPPPTTPSQPFQWTQFQPSANTRVIYLSSAQGRNSNDCLSEQTPCKTIARGMSLLRDGSPDWLLLKRGDVWNERFGDWTKSGRSKNEPMVIASFGTSTVRPLINTGEDTAMNSSNESIRHLSIIGLHLNAHTNSHFATTRNPYAGGIFGIYFISNGENILIEDCRIENYGTGISMHGVLEVPQSQWPANAWKDVRLRRNVIIDNYADDSDGQGVFVAGVDGILLEENILDHNGWGENVALDLRDHNVYISEVSGTTNAVVRGNIISRGDGAHVRPGGIVENNLFLRTSVSLMVGMANNPVIGGITATVKDNVILEGGNQSQLDRSWGLALDHVGEQGAEVSNNILAHGKSTDRYGREAVQFAPQWSKFSVLNKQNMGLKKVDFHDNIVYNWGGSAHFGAHTAPPAGGVKVRNNIFYDATKRPRDGSTEQVSLGHVENIDPRLISFTGNTYYSSEPQDEWFSVSSGSGGQTMNFSKWQTRSGENGSAGQPSFPDPTRTVATYHQSIGGAATNEAFLNQARTQSKGSGMGVLSSGAVGTLPANSSSWNDVYTAKKVNAYIRAGFGR